MNSNTPWAGLIPVAVLAVGFVIYCVVDIAHHDVKIIPKWAWIVVSCASIPLGGIAYLLFGRGSNRS